MYLTFNLYSKSTSTTIYKLDSLCDHVSKIVIRKLYILSIRNIVNSEENLRKKIKKSEIFIALVYKLANIN